MKKTKDIKLSKITVNNKTVIIIEETEESRAIIFDGARNLHFAHSSITGLLDLILWWLG